MHGGDLSGAGLRRRLGARSITAGQPIGPMGYVCPQVRNTAQSPAVLRGFQRPRIVSTNGELLGVPAAPEDPSLPSAYKVSISTCWGVLRLNELDRNGEGPGSPSERRMGRMRQRLPRLANVPELISNRKQARGVTVRLAPILKV